MTWVPVNDLSRALAAQREDLLRVLGGVLDGGWLVHGPEHRAFEAELAAYLGVRHAVAVGNGTDALELALRVACPPDRTTVVTAANCGGYATTAARSAGLRVRYADVEPATHLLSPQSVAAALDDTVGVVVVTHLYGRTADVAALRDVCAPSGVVVLEDCAQAIGARTTAGAAGSLGDLATFSFYPTKNLGALGDGGAVVTDDDELAAGVLSVRQYGWVDKYTIARAGGRNSRLDELQAAVLRYRLPLVDAWNARRREIIATYADAAGPAVRVLPAPGAAHAAHLAVVESDRRDDLVAHLARHEVRTDVHYPVPDHRQPLLAPEHEGLRLPVTESLVGRICSLPCFPELTEPEIGQVCDALASF